MAKSLQSTAPQVSRKMLRASLRRLNLASGGRSARSTGPTSNHWKHQSACPSPVPASISFPPPVPSRRIRSQFNTAKSWSPFDRRPLSIAMAGHLRADLRLLRGSDGRVSRYPRSRYPRKGQTAYDRADNLVVACRDVQRAQGRHPVPARSLPSAARGRLPAPLWGAHLESVLDIVRKAIERPFSSRLPAQRHGPDGAGPPPGPARDEAAVDSRPPATPAPPP